jgi:hypothetical protein
MHFLHVKNLFCIFPILFDICLEFTVHMGSEVPMCQKTNRLGLLATILKRYVYTTS